jgi:hypothetical protein
MTRTRGSSPQPARGPSRCRTTPLSQVGGKPDPDNLLLDTGTTDRVLLAEWFIYWGGDAPQIPERFSEVIHPGIGEKLIDDDVVIGDFLAWATSEGKPGVIGDPCEWKYPPKKKKIVRSLRGLER